MKILIKSIEPEYTDASTLEGWSFLRKGDKVVFTVVANTTRAQGLTLAGEFFWQGEPNVEEIEKEVISLIKKTANDST